MTEPLRVLHVIDTIGNAGAEQLLPRMARVLDKERFELHVCGLRPLPDSVTLPQLQALGVPILVLRQRGSYDLPALFALARYIRSRRIDLIHTHLLGGDVMGRLAGGLTRRPVVSSIHTSREDFDGEPRRRQWLERWTGRLWCAQFITVSSAFRAEMAEWYGVPDERVVAIPNAVEAGAFQRAIPSEARLLKHRLTGRDGPLVTTVARLVPAKGHEHLLRAAQLVVAERPDVHFVLVGDGPLRAELERRVAELGLERHVTFTGFSAHVPEILASSDLFVLPSAVEGMPLALLEALAAGCPAIATAVGGVAEVLADGRTGLIVPPAAPGALAAAIRRCLVDPAWAAGLAAAGQAAVMDGFGTQAWARRWEALYLEHARRDRSAPASARRAGPVESD